jgi:hypothetical protein
MEFTVSVRSCETLRSERVAVGEHEDPLGLEARVTGENGAPLQPHGAQDGLFWVRGREAGSENLCQVLVHKALVPLRDPAHDLPGQLLAPVEDGFVLVDLVYGETHSGVDLPLAHDLHERRNATLLAGLDRPL